MAELNIIKNEIVVNITQIGSDSQGEWWAFEVNLCCFPCCRRFTKEQVHSDIKYNRNIVVGCKYCKRTVSFRMDKYLIMDYISELFFNDEITENEHNYFIEKTIEAHNKFSWGV